MLPRAHLFSTLAATAALRGFDSASGYVHRDFHAETEINRLHISRRMGYSFSGTSTDNGQCEVCPKIVNAVLRRERVVFQSKPFVSRRCS
jgi:hypothetical protein